MTRYGCVVLTQGDRSEDLRAAVASVLAQQGVEVDCLVVGNGWTPSGLPAGVRTLALPHNLGIPAGRNAGIAAVRGDLVALLDDDAAYAAPDVLASVARLFDAEPALGIVSLRLVDPTGRPAQRRHVPRLRAGDPARSSDVTTFLEGASVVRRDVFEAAGDFPARFFYAHEGTDVAWRAIDAGFRVRYVGDVVVHHPAVAATRHGYFHHLSARNRVWLARRNLPLPIAVCYVAIWFTLTMARLRRVDDARDALRGFGDGLTQDCGPRRPLRWRTVWRMTRAGRPPLI